MEAYPYTHAYELFPRAKANLAEEELYAAESNCDAILQAAETMIRRSLLFHDIRNPTGMIEPLRELVAKLKVIYAFSRRELLSRFPGTNIRGRLAPEGYERPTFEDFSFDNQQTMCPMVLFFRIIARGLNNYRIRVARGNWDSLYPLCSLLDSLKDKLTASTTQASRNKKAKFPFWPGLTGCIMFHEVDCIFTIASSSPRYQQMSGLSMLGKAVRRRHMDEMNHRAGPETQAAIQRMLRLCDMVQQPTRLPVERDQNPFEHGVPASVPGAGAHVPGVGATFTPGSGYMPTCFLDHFRFVMARPPGSIEDESKHPYKRPVYPSDACAEWELWMIRLSDFGFVPHASPDGRLRTPPQAVLACGTFPPARPQDPRQQPGGPLRAWNSAAPGDAAWEPPPKKREDGSCCCTVM